MRCCAAPATNFFDGMAGNIAGIDARLSPDLDDGDIARFSPAASGWSASRSGTPSASTTRSKARAVSPMQRKTPARAISSSSSTAIPQHDAARLTRIGNELATLPL